MSSEACEEDHDNSIILSQHGWRNCKIPRNLHTFLNYVPTWKDLIVLRPPETFSSRTLHFTWDHLFDASGVPFVPALQIHSKLAEGTYGKIFRSYRALYRPAANSNTRYQRFVDFFEIVTKRVEVKLTSTEKMLSKDEQEVIYAEEIQAILYESALHVLVYHTMHQTGFPTVIPELHDVVAISSCRTPTSASQIKSVLIQMEFVEGETLHTYLKHTFVESSTQDILEANDKLLLDILIQLCVYLDILQSKLRFNHRDLKVNNVLRRKQSVGWTRDIQHPLLPVSWTCRNDLVLIDFGFSCVACDEPRRDSLIQAGSWFKMEHDCMKEGRDMALFIYCLHSCFPLKHRISAELWTLLNKAMIATWGDEQVSLLDVGVGHDGMPFHIQRNQLDFNEGIYKFLRRSNTEVPGCAPKTFLTTLVKFNTDIYP